MFHNLKRRMIMKILFAMVLLMIVTAYGCTTDEAPVLEQETSDAVEIGDIIVEDAEELLAVDTEVSLDQGDTVITVEEDVEN
jgi:hypothetical protein